MPTTAYRATLDAYDGSPARSWCSGRNGWRDGIVEKARSQGLLMDAIVHAADVQDRDGGALLMASLFGAFPFLIKLYADGGYQGREFQSAMQRILARVNVEIVKRSGQAAGFVALPKRWIVERTFAWLGLPTTGQGLGMPQSQGARLPAPRLHPPHVETMQSHMMFSDTL
jgi:transposase